MWLDMYFHSRWSELVCQQSLRLILQTVKGCQHPINTWYTAVEGVEPKTTLIKHDKLYINKHIKDRHCRMWDIIWQCLIGQVADSLTFQRTYDYIVLFLSLRCKWITIDYSHHGLDSLHLPCPLLIASFRGKIAEFLFVLCSSMSLREHSFLGSRLHLWFVALVTTSVLSLCHLISVLDCMLDHLPVELRCCARYRSVFSDISGNRSFQVPPFRDNS